MKKEPKSNSTSQTQKPKNTPLVNSSESSFFSKKAEDEFFFRPKNYFEAPFLTNKKEKASDMEAKNKPANETGLIGNKAKRILRQTDSQIEHWNDFRSLLFLRALFGTFFLNVILESEIENLTDWKSKQNSLQFSQFEIKNSEFLLGSMHSVAGTAISGTGLGFAGSFFYSRLVQVYGKVKNNEKIKNAQYGNEFLRKLQNSGTKRLFKENTMSALLIFNIGRHYGRMEQLQKELKENKISLDLFLQEPSVSSFAQRQLLLMEQTSKEYTDAYQQYISACNELMLYALRIPQIGKEVLDDLKVRYAHFQGLKGDKDEIEVECEVSPIDYSCEITSLGYRYDETYFVNERTKFIRSKSRRPEIKDNLEKIGNYTLHQLQKGGFKIKVILKVDDFSNGRVEDFQKLQPNSNLKENDLNDAEMKDAIFHTPLKNFDIRYKSYF